MALSIARWRGEHDGHQEFDVDIGSNRYYAWGVGSGTRTHDGVRLLAARSTTSPLLGPLQPSGRGRAVLRVPSDTFTADQHHLQLLSFRDEELRGPAASDIVEVPWGWTPRADRTEDPMSAATLSVSESTTGTPMPRLSEAQFLGALAGVVSQVLPIVQQALPIVGQVAPVIGRLLAGGAPAAPAAPTGAGPGGSAGAPASSSPAPDLAQLLSQLLTQLQQAGAPATAAAPTAAAPTGGTSGAASVPYLRGSYSRGSSSTGPARALPERYSRASVAPLLAALPALAPLLQSVLTPQTVQSLIQAADPNRLLQTGIAGLLDAARIGQQATDNLHEHLRQLNPGLGDEALIPLLAAMSTSASYDRRRPRHKLSRVVRLALPDLAPVELGGYPQVAFRHGDEITLPVEVDTPRPIPRASLHVCVKDAGTLRWVAERRWKLGRVDPGRLPQTVALPSPVAHRLTPGREYLVEIALNWPGSQGLMGATTSQLVRVVGDALFDSMDTGGPPIRLDDVDRDRDWWHRVYADSVDERGTRLRARLEYELRLDPGSSPRIHRSETEVDLEQVTERRAEGTLRAGMSVPLPALSRLAARLTGRPFDEPTMHALATPEFAAAFDRAATCSVALSGRRGSQLAIWVWPEVKLHQAFLSRPGQVSAQTGQILSYETEAVSVPVPGLVHVLTTRSS